MTAKIDVKNVPEYALQLAYWVVRFDEQKQAWFYGAWDDVDEANRVAIEVKGAVVEANG